MIAVVRASFRNYDLWDHTEPGSQESIFLGLIPHCHLLEILNNFIFELVFCK